MTATATATATATYAICPVTGGLYLSSDAVVQCLPGGTLRDVSTAAADSMAPCDRRSCDHFYDDGDGDGVDIGSETWCAHCAEEHTVTSDFSGDRFHPDDAVTVRVFTRQNASAYETREWSQSEVDDNADTCGHCDHVVYHTTRDNRITVGAEEWCPRCVARDALSCDACGSLHAGDDSLSDEHGDGCYCCFDCVPPSEDDEDDEDDDDDDGAISEYHTGKKRGFRPIGQGPAFFGIELEMVCTDDRSDVARRIRSTWGDVVASIERDGSLPSTGCELVSHPQSLTSWRTFFASDRSIKGAKSHDTDCCGLHVHISRAAFSDLTWAKVALFLHDPKNEGALSTLFRRSPNGYAARGLYTSTLTSARLASKKGSGPRYRVVNFENDQTVEIRWGRGSLKTSTVLATVELCDAIVRYCEVQALSDVGDMDRLLAWLRKPSQGPYRALRNYAALRGVCKPFYKPAPTTPTTQHQHQAEV